MKKFLLYTSYTTLGILTALYLAFLFVLPNAIDLNKYIPEIKKIAKEQANIDIEINNPKIVTTPHLQAGIKTDSITIKLSDGSTLLNTEGIKARISLPNLFLLTIKIPCLEIISPNINLEIANGEQFKIVRLVEDILNKQKSEAPKVVEQKPLPFDPSIIKIKVPNVKVSDYKIIIDDLKSGHNLTLKGEELKAGYNNGKFAKLKTNASILSDDKENITANIAINTFIPAPKPKDPDDDPAEKIVLPFVNPVLMYRDYNLESKLNTKLNIRQTKKGNIITKGYLNIDDITMNLSGLQLPKSHIRSKFYGTSVDIDTDLVVAKEQAINVNGNVNYSTKPKLNLNIYTDRIFFNDMIILSRALLDTLHIKNNLASIKADGYWAARTQIKTDFNKLKSKGAIIARDGNISNGITNLIFDNINANLIFEGDTLKITDTHAYVNNHLLKVEGTVDTDSYTNIKLHSEKLPLSGLYTAFAPADLKKSISLTSGDLSIDAKIQGELKKSIANANIILQDLAIQDKKNTFTINNETLVVGIVTDLKTLDGNITNKNFLFALPTTNSTIKNPSLVLKLDEKDIKLLPFDILVNNASKITFNGDIKEYSSQPQINFIGGGILNAKDIEKFAGRDAEPFIAAEGNLPIKLKFDGNDKKQDFILQIKSDSNNYLTPIDIDSMQGKQSIFQAKFDHKGDRLHIRKTGFYTNILSFTDNMEENLLNSKKIAEVSGTIVDLNTKPFINIIKLAIPKELNAKLSAFKNSEFKMNGHLAIFGKMESPLLRGNFKIHELKIPELLITLDETNTNLIGKNIDFDIKNLLLNGSDINIDLKTDINPHPQFTISKLDINSKLIDLDKLMKVSEKLTKYTAPPVANSKPATDIPVMIRNGSIDFKKIKTGAIEAFNTTGEISLKKNNFFLDNLRTRAFDGIVNGNIAVNLISMALDIKTEGQGLNVEKALLGLANMKNTLSGNLAFNTDISLSGTTMEEQMKSLKGDVTFVMTDGQLGPFGRLENMILAENIRESQFFQTALGGVINNLATIDTTHFNTLTGLISFEDGTAHINPITSVGNVMSLHISGDFNLLENTTDMKVRAKLGSIIASMLGPISQLNPINLVQATPGLNVVMAQAFSLFCEQLTAEESAALPSLASELDDKMATKFQIVLRGDVAKPLTLIKSFKWLALASEIEQAQGFVSTLPDPSIVEDPNNATIEAILQAQELKAKEDAKLSNKIIRFFKKEE